MSEKDKLRTYRGKRHFDRTAEPSGERAMKDEAPPAMGEEPTFVVQIHDASTMHFDFRLKVESRSGRAAACCATLATWGYESTRI